MSPLAYVASPVPPLADESVPVTPVVRGKPVPLVNVTEAGVPKTGATRVGPDERTLLPEPVLVVTPVPPLATASVPANVIVPDVVMGPPLVVRPVVPPLTATLVTVPVEPPETAMLIPPDVLVTVIPDPAVMVESV